MKYFSVCSGIEAASCAWEALGWKPVGFSEIEPFPSAVLAYRFPDVKNYGDMTKYKEWENVGQFDVLVGGTPCQSFSVAGLRKGLDDPRGNLMLTFGAITNHFRPTWIVWENVPGVLSSNGGRDFGTFLGMLAELGYGFAYRILDAQFFGVPQRRRRVFVVGCLGDWRRAAAVLFESESLRGDNPPSREAREGAARGIEIGPSGGGFTDVNPTLDTRRKDGPIRNQLAGAVMVSHTLRGEGFDASENGTGRGTPIVPVQCFERNTPDGHARLVGDIAPTLNRMGGGQRETCIFMPVIMAAGQGNAEISENRSPTLNCNHEAPILAHMTGAGYWKEGAGTLRAREQDSHENLVIQSTVRRITPRECERLQGFPDDWTKIPWRGKPADECTDGNRYKACGNSMAVPVMLWIGERIKTYILQKGVDSVAGRDVE